MSALYDSDGIDGPFEKAISKPLKAPPWPRCVRCSKPCKPSEMERDELGRAYCSGGRCGTAAIEEVSQGRLRREVFLRDGGICGCMGCRACTTTGGQQLRACGLDAEKLRSEIDGLLREAAAEEAEGRNPSPARLVVESRIHQLVRVGFDRHAVESGSALWEAAHVNARVFGGATHLAQAVTKCLACHKTDSKKLAGDRATKRRPFRRS